MNKKRNSPLIKAADILCVIILTVMLLVCFTNVCSRRFLHMSIAASEEITTNLFVILSLVGSALAARSHSHVGLNVFTDKLSPKNKLFHNVFEGIIGMTFMGYLSWYGLLRVRQQLSTGQESAGLGLPIWIYGVLCLIGFVLVFAVFAEIMIQAIIRLCRKDYEENNKTEESKE